MAATTDFIFFDVRDTLGLVFSRGQLTLFKPSTERLLEALKSVVDVPVGVITNLPANVTSADGRAMLEQAGVLKYLHPKGVVINHDVKLDKPDPKIYARAAEQVGVPIERCLFVGENFIEVLGAWRAGMPAVLKPYPPGGEFGFKASIAEPATPTSSGRLFEILLEEEHALGKRITQAAAKIAENIRSGQGSVAALALLVYVLENFVEPYHHRKEEDAVFPIALARGLSRSALEQTLLEHDSGRLYFKAIATAAKRAQGGKLAALTEAAALIDALVSLYRAHAQEEDLTLFPQLGSYFTDADDAIVVELMRKIGPQDITPYLALVESLERAAGLRS